MAWASLAKFLFPKRFASCSPRAGRRGRRSEELPAMQALTNFLAMGGYAGFVWPAYGMTALVLGGLLVQTLRRSRRARRELAALQRERPARARRGGP
jgi:heme exporter protein D